MTLYEKAQRLRNLDINDPRFLNWCEIVKYKPESYNKQGVYTKNEWISVGDIGKSFDDAILTQKEYLKLENAHINTVKELATATGCHYLSVVGIEHYGLHRSKAFNAENKAMFQIVSQYHEGQRLALNDIDNVLKLCLREQYWCILANGKHHMQLYVGWDYYLHFYSLLPTETVKAIARKYNLYCNPREK